MKHAKIVLACALAFAVTAKAQEAAGLQDSGTETVLHALLRVAQQSRTPLGIVQGNDGLLCRPITEIVPSRPSDVGAMFERVATQAGYQAVTVAGTTVLRPYALSDLLYRAFSYRFDSFPTLTKQTMATMGTTLNGWLEVQVNNATGYVTENAYGSDAEMLTLSSSAAINTAELANKMASLGSKGVWILSEKQGDAGQGPALSFRIFSYKDNWRDLDHIRCPVPKPK